MTLTPTPLTFPPSTHAKLSPRTYLTAHLQPPSSSSTSSQDRQPPPTTTTSTAPSSPPLRPSSRHPPTPRVPHIHTNNLTHTHGSAVVRLGDTAVVCGVQGSVLLASSVPPALLPAVHHRTTSEHGHDRSRRKKDERHTLAQLNLLTPHIELNTGCAPEYLGGGGAPGPVAQGVVQRVVSALHTADVVALEKLVIRPVSHAASSASSSSSSNSEEDEDVDVDMDAEEGGVALPAPAAQPTGAGYVGDNDDDNGGWVKAFYALNLHVYVLSLDHGPHGLFDAVWMAVVAALATTRVPEVGVDPESDAVEVDWERPRRGVCRPGGWPVASSFGVFRMGRDGLGGGEEEEGNVVLADPDAFEEGLCEEVVTLLVREEEGQVRVLGMEKQGGGVVGVGEMRELVGLAGERCKTVNEVLEKECRE